MAAGILFGERLAPVQVVGGALILAGVLLSQLPARRGTGAGAGAGAEAEPVLPQPVVRLGEE